MDYGYNITFLHFIPKIFHVFYSTNQTFSEYDRIIIKFYTVKKQIIGQLTEFSLK